MKPKVLSVLPRRLFEASDVSLPIEMAFTFQHPLEEEGIITACKGMDFLLIAAGFPIINRRIL